MRGRFFFAKRAVQALLIFAVMLLSSACSTTQSTRGERRGLFDRLAEGSSSSRPEHHSSEFKTSPPVATTMTRQRMIWPLKNIEVTSAFGKRKDGRHEGVDLRAQKGTAIYAAQEGRVLYADHRIRGYGNMIVLQHAGGFSTVYAHASKVSVHRGQWVKQGQKIAISGQSGRASGPHLHFEVRYGVAAIDPLRVLPHQAVAKIEKPEPRMKRGLALR